MSYSVIKKRRTLTLIYLLRAHIYSHRMEPPTLRALTLNILRIYAWQVIIMYNHRVMIDRFHRDQEYSCCFERSSHIRRPNIPTTRDHLSKCYLAPKWLRPFLFGLLNTNLFFFNKKSL